MNIDAYYCNRDSYQTYFVSCNLPFQCNEFLLLYKAIYFTIKFVYIVVFLLVLIVNHIYEYDFVYYIYISNSLCLKYVRYAPNIQADFVEYYIEPSIVWPSPFFRDCYGLFPSPMPWPNTISFLFWNLMIFLMLVLAECSNDKIVRESHLSWFWHFNILYIVRNLPLVDYLFICTTI